MKLYFSQWLWVKTNALIYFRNGLSQLGYALSVLYGTELVKNVVFMWCVYKVPYTFNHARMTKLKFRVNNSLKAERSPLKDYVEKYQLANPRLIFIKSEQVIFSSTGVSSVMTNDSAPQAWTDIMFFCINRPHKQNVILVNTKF